MVEPPLYGKCPQNGDFFLIDGLPNVSIKTVGSLNNNNNKNNNNNPILHLTFDSCDFICIDTV